MANDFSGDSNCVALWRFESGAMTTDSKDSNTLVALNSPTENTTDYKEGACAADIVWATSKNYRIDADDVSADFPLKSGTTNKKISVCGW